jgi:hypothetical protein
VILKLAEFDINYTAWLGQAVYFTAQAIARIDPFSVILVRLSNGAFVTGDDISGLFCYVT